MNSNKLLQATLIVLCSIPYCLFPAQSPISRDCNNIGSFTIEISDANDKKRIFECSRYSFETLGENRDAFLKFKRDSDAAKKVISDEKIIENYSRLATDDDYVIQEAVDRAKNLRKQRMLRYPDGNYINIAWMIYECGAGERTLFAQLGMGSFLKENPQGYEDKHIVCFGINPLSSYKESGYAVKFMRVIMKYLKRFDQFKDVVFAMQTRSDNQAGCMMAQELGFLLHGTTVRNMRVNYIDHSQEMLLYIEGNNE